MHILFLSTHSLESPGGGGRFYPLAKALVKKGFQVTMITLHHDYANVKRRHFVQSGVVIKYVGQMHVRKTAMGKTYFKPWKLLWITAVSTIHLTWAGLTTPCDAVQVCKAQPMNGAAAWIIHILKRKPVYLDSDDLEAVNNRFSGKWQQKIVAWFENWIPSFVKGITVNSSFIWNHYVNLGFPKEQIFWVPNGADKERFDVLNQPSFMEKVQDLRRNLQIDPKTSVVIYVGSISLTSHAIDLLLKSFVFVRQWSPNTVLLIVGTGEDLSKLKELASKLNILDSVYFLGRIPMENIPYYFCMGDVSVDPLRDTLAAQSSFSLKLIESLASGIPCVTTDIGDRKTMIGEAGVAVPPDDEVSLAYGISTILNNADNAFQMRQAAIEMRDKLWWDNRVEAFTKLYGETLNENIENAAVY